MICKHKSKKLNVPKYYYITKNSIKHQSFLYTQLNDQTILFQTSQFRLSYLLALSLNVKQFYLTHWKDSIRSCHSGPVWTRERWQRQGTPHSQEPQHFWSHTIRVFSVISRTVVGPRFYLRAEMQSVYSKAPADWAIANLRIEGIKPCFILSYILFYTWNILLCT